jgi:hypothetical protein
MACLDAQDLVDFDDPKASKVLQQIEMAEPTSELITEEVIQEEYDGFLEWIEYSAKCHDYVCGAYTDPCCNPANAPVPPRSTGPLGGCTEKNLTDSFQNLIFRWHSRCHGCHSKCDPDYDAPCWLIEYYDKHDASETRKAAQNSMYNLLGSGAIDREEPKQSKLLLKPLAEDDGGLYHGGGDKFLGHWDASYQDFVLWLEMYSSCHKGQEYQAPIVRIMSPQTKKKIFAGDEIIFLARADDLQDGPVEGEKLQWSSLGFGRQSFTGTGPFVATMPAGKHVVRVTATDSEGNTGYRETRLRVRLPKIRPSEVPADVISSSDATTPPVVQSPGISGEYPNDKNIQSDPVVIWTQNFENMEGASITDSFESFEGEEGIDIVKGSANESLGTKALELRAGGSAPLSTALVKNLPESSSPWFLRYYLRHPKGASLPTGGLWLGGRVGTETMPDLDETSPPLGNDAFSFGVEPHTTPHALFLDVYGRWMHMHHDDGQTGNTVLYPPNRLIHSSKITLNPDEWNCIEIKVQLNTDLSSMEGAGLSFWFNNELVYEYSNQSEPGFWIGSDFCSEDADLAPCTDINEISEEQFVPLNLQLRNAETLQPNYLWPRLKGTPEKEVVLQLDNIVLAHKRIGCAVIE